MAIIEIRTTPEEQQKVLQVFKTIQGETVALSKVSKLAKMPENRLRYVVTDLIEAGKLKRIPTKALSKHYVRYMYEVSADA